VSLGGIAHALPLARWPALPGIRYIMAGPNVPNRPDMIRIESLKLDHLDCLAGCDALVTKPGYGSIVEAACHGIPVIFARRGDWPDEDGILAWLAAVGVACEISRDELSGGMLAGALRQVWDAPPAVPVNPIGNLHAAERIAALLRAR
jgi:UDP-N-acetylglucosamine:LPS N-acetylglucosamine transferase